MSQRAKELSERFERFNKEVIAFVEKCTDENWEKVCSGEKWPVELFLLSNLLKT